MNLYRMIVTIEINVEAKNLQTALATVKSFESQIGQDTNEHCEVISVFRRNEKGGDDNLTNEFWEI